MHLGAFIITALIVVNRVCYTHDNAFYGCAIAIWSDRFDCHWNFGPGKSGPRDHLSMKIWSCRGKNTL